MTDKKTEGTTSAKVASSAHVNSQANNNTQSKKTSTKGRGRTRNYATVVYPESAPADWLAILDNLHVPAFVSPLHDADVNSDNTPKKARYHVLMMFAGVKTVEQLALYVDMLGIWYTQIIRKKPSTVRAMCVLSVVLIMMQ